VHRLLISTLITLLAVTRPAIAAEPAVEEEVSFDNGAVTLTGTLTLPPGSGPHPALVFLHGSGPTTREGAESYAHRYAGLGLASVRFDKRGTGTSSGSWLSSSLEDLARDGVAAIEYLEARAEIDPQRIGFWGVSQAGWVATQATAFSDDIAFLVIISGGGATPYESELFSYRRAFERAGLAQEEIEEGLRVIDLYMAYLGTGDGRDEVSAAIAAARSSRWYEHAQLDRILPSTEEGRQAWSWVARWDPKPLIEQMGFPVLLLFGGRDTQNPTDLSVTAWRQSLERAGNRHFTIKTFSEAGHGIRIWRDGHHGGERPPFADGYHETMDRWLAENVVNRVPAVEEVFRQAD
jgi:pimeloyl-ACP methyl ester carboxylesterase